MGKRLKDYISYIKNQLQQELKPQEKDALCAELLIQISFFQHERFIHLIVTIAFAFFTIATLLTSLFYQSIGLYLLMFLFFILLIPYIKHYYHLENGVQKLYCYYDELKK